jgi:hypothetical protein
MTTIKSTIINGTEIFHIPCGSGFLCSVSSDMSDPWTAHDPSDDMPSDDVATDKDIESALEKLDA